MKFRLLGSSSTQATKDRPEIDLDLEAFWKKNDALRHRRDEFFGMVHGASEAGLIGEEELEAFLKAAWQTRDFPELAQIKQTFLQRKERAKRRHKTQRQIILSQHEGIDKAYFGLGKLPIDDDIHTYLAYERVRLHALITEISRKKNPTPQDLSQFFTSINQFYGQVMEQRLLLQANIDIFRPT